MHSKKLSLVLVLLLIFGIAGAAFAQEATPPATPPVQGGGPGGRGGQRGGFGAEYTAIVHATALALNLTDAEVMTEIQGGKSLADIIAAHNGDLQAITAASVTAATDAINAAATAGTITQDNATRMQTNLADMVSRIISGQLGRGGFGGGAGGGFNDQGALIDAILTATKLDRQTLVQESSGKTLAEVVTAHGGTVDQVVADAITAETNQMNEVVKLKLLTQDQANQYTSTLKDIYTAAMSVQWDQLTLTRGIFSVIPLAIWETGLKPQDVATRLAAGDTLAKILADNKVDVNQFVSDAAVEFQARLNAAITDGRMTQDQAGSAVQFFKTRLTDLLNGVTPTFPGPAATPEATAAATAAS